MKMFSLAACCLLVSAPIASAAPLDPAQVPADAKWVVHLDLDAARNSSVAQAMHQRHAQREDVKKRLDKFRQATGLDPARDLSGLTMYDNRFVRHHGVAIVRTKKLDQAKLVNMLTEKHPDHKQIPYGDYLLRSWTMGRGDHPHEVTACFFGETTVLFSRDVDQVKAALDVMAGKANGLAADSPLAAEAAAGTILLVRGFGMADQVTPFQSKVVRDSHRLDVALGQRGDEVFMQGDLETESPEVAVQVTKILEGIKALARLQRREDKAATAVVDGMTIASDGTTVSLRWKAAADDVTRAAEAMREARRASGKDKNLGPNKTDRSDSPE